jgi:hypothetical protein
MQAGRHAGTQDDGSLTSDELRGGRARELLEVSLSAR